MAKMTPCHRLDGLSRRGFLGLLATGAVGACVAAQVLTGWLPEPVRRRAACEYLREEWLTFARVHRRGPQQMTAGRELFEAYEGERLANERLTLYGADWRTNPSLTFKGARLYSVGRGWRVACHGDG